MDKQISTPVYSPHLDERDFLALRNAFESGWISSKGPEISKFERLVSEFTGFNFSSSTSNGTTALHLAFSALDVNSDTRVFAPAMTYVASVTPAIHLGAEICLVDVDEKTWLADFKSNNGGQINNPDLHKILLSVDLFGSPANLHELNELRGKNTKVVSDSAESLGSRYGLDHAGKGSDITTLSFFGNKTITTGEGGMVLTNDETIHDRVGKLKNQGLSVEREYFHDLPGFNFRMTNLQAAIGVSQILKIQEILNLKKSIYNYYDRYLDKKDIKRQVFIEGSESSHWMCAFLAGSETIKSKIRNNLLINGIETRPFFTPLSDLPFMERYSSGQFPVSEDLSRRGFILPSGPNLTESQTSLIVDIVNSSL